MMYFQAVRNENKVKTGLYIFKLRLPLLDVLAQLGLMQTPVKKCYVDQIKKLVLTFLESLN